MGNYAFGMIGLGTMGRNLLLNMADHGFSVAGYDKNAAQVTTMVTEAAGRPVWGTTVLADFVQSLQTPRAIMMLVPAGAPVDAVIADFVPHLAPGDLLIDGGNSHFVDTNRRARALAGQGFHFMGMGVSGGEEGARLGPSMMPGGDPTAYEIVRPVLEAIAARVNNEPCVAYVGSESAGHYVKMVHNGIEYGLMQLISEAYDLLHRGAGFTDAELHQTFSEWNRGNLQSFLVEITADIFAFADPLTGELLVNKILDRARSKGTGKWTSQDAMDLAVPLPTVDAAVTMRALSARKEERVVAAQVLGGAQSDFEGDKAAFGRRVQGALYFATIATYAQGMAMLQEASKTYDYGVNLETVARIWRGGCIIRAALLEPIRAAYAANPALPNLMLAPAIAQALLQHQDDARDVIKSAVEWGIAAPALFASLAYFDGYRTERLPLNLLQAQRDKFGAHTYERTDQPGIFHTNWNALPVST